MCTEGYVVGVCLLGRGLWTGGEAQARRPRASCPSPLSSVSSLSDGNDVFCPAFPTTVLPGERVKEDADGNAFHNLKGQTDAKDHPCRPTSDIVLLSQILVCEGGGQGRPAGRGGIASPCRDGPGSRRTAGLPLCGHGASHEGSCGQPAARPKHTGGAVELGSPRGASCQVRTPLRDGNLPPAAQGPAPRPGRVAAEGLEGPKARKPHALRFRWVIFCTGHSLWSPFLFW